MRSSFSKLFLSLFGSGYVSQLAPGTVGSLFSLVILYGIEPLFSDDVLHKTFFWVMVFLFIGIISYFFIIKHAEKNKFDHSWIVIDEFLGMMIATLPLFFFPAPLWAWGLAFLIFRVFDIWKPLNIRTWDNKKGAFPVIFDDILAGAYTGVIIVLILLSI